MAQIFKFNRRVLNGMSSEAIKLRAVRRDPASKAAEVLKYFGINEYPINPVRIAQSLGIRVIERLFPGKNISGIIRMDEKETLIYINKNDTPSRQRFTIAHEIGHFFLHMDGNHGFIDNAVTLYRANETPISSDMAQQEKEANAFAAALLMPENDVRFEWIFADSVEDIAKEFYVSADAMKIRLKNLGILQ